MAKKKEDINKKEVDEQFEINNTESEEIEVEETLDENDILKDEEEEQEENDIKFSENKITKETLDERIERGDFRIVKGFKFKDKGKELAVDYKDTDRNYFLKDNELIEHFKELHPHQEFIILE